MSHVAKEGNDLRLLLPRMTALAMKARSLVWCPKITLNYFRVFRPECCVARRRHSPAMTSPARNKLRAF